MARMYRVIIDGGYGHFEVHTNKLTHDESVELCEELTADFPDMVYVNEPYEEDELGDDGISRNDVNTRNLRGVADGWEDFFEH